MNFDRFACEIDDACFYFVARVTDDSFMYFLNGFNKINLKKKHRKQLD